MQDPKQYYKELGKLVYAVAVADGSIQDEEIRTLHQFVMKELASYEPKNDSSGMNYAFYTDFEFQATTEQKPNVEDCISSYTRFVENHFEKGDEALIRRSMKLLEAVAKAYFKQNEKQIISSVKVKLDQISGDILKTA
jgi:hypothetical protein